MSDLALATVPMASHKERDYYADLEFPCRVDDMDVIKKRYKRLALTKHPDRGGDKDEFKIVSDAYEVLSDTEKKAEYDLRRVDIPSAPPDPDSLEAWRPCVPIDMSNHVPVVKYYEGGRRACKYVACDQLDLARKEGWKHVVPATPSWRDPITGEDTRECPVNDASGPTEKFFARECEMLKNLGVDYKSIVRGPPEAEHSVYPELLYRGLGYTEEMHALNLRNGGPPPLRFVSESGEIKELPPYPDWMKDLFEQDYENKPADGRADDGCEPGNSF